MNVKGIAWVGNLYQKFETMCLEVEDIICQDTAKFVENQVETVGASVKKFYSDVMQDLLPPSILDDEKVAVCNSAPDRYENVIICKKPVKGMQIARSKFYEEKSTENSKVIADTKRDINHLLPHALCHADDPYSVSFECPAKGVHLNSDPRKECDENMCYKLDGDARESTRNCEESSHVNSKRNYEDSCYQADKTATAAATLVKDKMCDLATESSNETEIEEVATDSENENLSCDESRLLSYGDLSAELNGISSIDGSVTVIESSLNEDVQLDHYPDVEISMFHLGRSECWSLDENDSEPGADEMKVDESCIVVNGDEFHLDSHEETAKSQAYKIKMSRAFSFMKKSKRKQEYEELAARHGGHGFGKETNLVQNLEVNEQKLLTEDASEHDWQLL